MSGILATFPLESSYVIKLVRLVLSTVSPNLLYLPHLSRSLLQVTMVKEKRNADLIDKVHKQDVVDASSALLNINNNNNNPSDLLIARLSEEQAKLTATATSKPDDNPEGLKSRDGSQSPLSMKDIDIEYYQTEEDKVTEWEVLTEPGTPPQLEDTADATSATTLSSSAGGGGAGSGNFNSGDYSSVGSLASVLLHKILSTFTVLSDTESNQITNECLKPEIFFPLVGHNSADVHSPALDIIGLIIERSAKGVSDAFKEQGCYYQMAALIQDAPTSNHMISSTLSLLHGHPVDVNIPFEFNKQSPPQLKLEAACLIPPLIVSSLSYLSLGKYFDLSLMYFCII